MILIILRIIATVWVTVSGIYLIMNVFNIQGPQWFIFFPIYSIFEVGIGHLCFFSSLLIMLWLLFKNYFKGISDWNSVELSFEVILINFVGILLTFVHSWWGSGNTLKNDTLLRILFICIMGGVIGVWPVLVFQSFRLRVSEIILRSGFIATSVLLIMAGSILLFYSTARIQKISYAGNLKEHIFLAIIALLLNLIVVKGWRSRCQDKNEKK